MSDNWEKVVNKLSVLDRQIGRLKVLEGGGGGVIPSARVYNNAVIAVANNTDVVLTFNSERYDTDTIHSTITNTSRLTCKTAGIYDIWAAVEFAGNATGIRYLSIRLNGTTYIARIGAPATSTIIHALNVSCHYSLTANDYLEALVYQNSGAALNVNSAGNYSPEFGMTYLGKAS